MWERNRKQSQSQVVSASTEHWRYIHFIYSDIEREEGEEEEERERASERARGHCVCMWFSIQSLSVYWSPNLLLLLLLLFLDPTDSESSRGGESILFVYVFFSDGCFILVWDIVDKWWILKWASVMFLLDCKVGENLFLALSDPLICSCFHSFFLLACFWMSKQLVRMFWFYWSVIYMLKLVFCLWVFWFMLFSCWSLICLCIWFFL